MKRRTFPAGLGATGVPAIVRAAGDLATVEGEDALPPLTSSACPMVTARK
jgi:hypothetical protein